MTRKQNKYDQKRRLLNLFKTRQRKAKKLERKARWWGGINARAIMATYTSNNPYSRAYFDCYDKECVPILEELATIYAAEDFARLSETVVEKLYEERPMFDLVHLVANDEWYFNKP